TGVAIAELTAEAIDDLPEMPFLTGIEGTAVTLGQETDDPGMVALMRLWRIILRADSQMAENLSELHYASDHAGLQLVFKNGTRVILGRSPTPRQFAMLESFRKRLENL